MALPSFQTITTGLKIETVCSYSSKLTEKLFFICFFLGTGRAEPIPLAVKAGQILC